MRQVRFRAGGNGAYALVRARRLYLLALYGLAAFAGVQASVLPPECLNSNVLLGFATGLLLALLLAADARIIGNPLPGTASWVVFFFWPVAAPICLIASRKLRGLWLLLVHAAALLGVQAVAAWTGWWLVTRLTASPMR